PSAGCARGRARTRPGRCRASGRRAPWPRCGDVATRALLWARLFERRRLHAAALDRNGTACDEPAAVDLGRGGGHDRAGEAPGPVEVEPALGVWNRREEQPRVRVEGVLEHL